LTCTPIWEGETGGPIYSAPAVANGKVYVGTYDEKLYAFDAAGINGCGAGVPRECTALWTATTGGQIFSSPAVANGVVYVGSDDDKLYAFDAAGVTRCSGGTCLPLWTGGTAGQVMSSPAVANGVVYVGSNDDKLYAFGVGCAGGGGSCSPLWSATTGGAVESSPAVANGVVYVGSYDKKLNAFSLIWTASSYTPMSPRRVLDSRPTGSGHTNIGLAGTFGAGVVREFGVAGAKYVGGGTAPAIPATAVAVTGNLTIVGETAAGVVDLGPTASASGNVTTINFVVGDTRANNVTVGLAGDGSLEAVYRSSSSNAKTDIIFDVTGFFTPGTAGSTYHPVAPGRVLDTRRSGSGVTHIGPLTKLPNRTVKTFPVAGVTPLGGSGALVPSGAVAVTGNVTVTNASSVGFVALGPTMTTAPSTSTANVGQGATVANGVTVALSGGNLAVVWCGTTGSSADVIFDVTGYFTADATGLSFYAIDPVRVLDTSAHLALTGPFASRTAETMTIAPAGQIPANAVGISGNLTLLVPSSAGWALISPEIVPSATTSTLNAPAGHSEANGFDVALGSDGHVALEWAGTTGSTADLAIDVTGYWK
jgi:hypothetical protein